MPRSPLHLAALSTVAVPGLDAVDARRIDSPTFDAAAVLDTDGTWWVARAPRTAAGGAALAAEVGLLDALARYVDAGDLPFDVPRVAGAADLPEGGRAVIHRLLPGRPLQLEQLGPGPGLAADLGRAIAAVHELPVDLVADLGLPTYTAEEYRGRRLTEVDEAAKTGRVPAALLRRWEGALEDVALWRFRATVTHGDLSAENVLVGAKGPTAVQGWTEAKVADPADDLAWLVIAAPHESIDSILEAYTMRRTGLEDRHLAARALLAGELTFARWLLHGERLGDERIIADAEQMLRELAEQVALDPGPFGSGSVPTPAVGIGEGAAVVEVAADVEVFGAPEGSGVPQGSELPEERGGPDGSDVPGTAGAGVPEIDDVPVPDAAGPSPDHLAEDATEVQEDDDVRSPFAPPVLDAAEGEPGGATTGGTTAGADASDADVSSEESAGAVGAPIARDPDGVVVEDAPGADAEVTPQP